MILLYDEGTQEQRASKQDREEQKETKSIKRRKNRNIKLNLYIHT